MQAATPNRIAVPYRPEMIQLFPDFERTGPDSGLVPHDPASTAILRNMGLDVPSAVLCHYDFPHPPDKVPFEAQRQTTVLLTENMRAYVLNGLGTGKTACILWAYHYLRSLGMVRKMLVVAPLSSLRETWMRHVFEFLGQRIVATVLHGDRDFRLRELARPEVDVFVINPAGMKVIQKALDLRDDIDVLAIDELATYRNKSKRSRAMRTYAHRVKWVWGATGAPIPHAPTDVWEQAQIVTPWTVPKYFTHFRDELMFRVNQFKYKPKLGSKEKAYAALQPSVRYTLDDVTELPPYVSRRIEVPLGPLQERVYKAIKNEAFSMIEQNIVTAANAGVVLNKLLQISLGYVYDDKHRTIPLDNQQRLDAMLDIVEGHDGKAIVFTTFIHSLQGLSAALKSRDIEHAVVSGATPIRQRDKIFSDFQHTDRPPVLLAHPACMAHSLTLTRASLVLWFGPVPDLELYDQANARIRRVGQRQRQLFAHLQSTAQERNLYQQLIERQSYQLDLLAMFAER